MKKLLATLAALTLVLSFAACGKQDVPPVTTDDSTVSSADTTTGTPDESRETTASSDTDAAATEDTTTEAPATSETEEAAKTTEATSTEAPTTSETTMATKPAETTETSPAETTATTTEATEATTEDTTAPTPDASANTALDVLSKIWAAYPADNKFSSFGGDIESAVMDAPGAVSLDAATLDRSLGFPQDSIEKISAGASLIHMLNANTFTCGAYQVKDGEDAAALAEAIRTNILARRWMCGMPDTVRILTVGDTVIALFAKDGIADTFVEAAQSVYPDLTVVVNDPIQ